MFRSETTDTRTGSGSANWIENRNALRSRIDYYLLTPLSVRRLSKIAHIRSVVSVLLR